MSCRQEEGEDKTGSSRRNWGRKECRKSLHFMH